jgi:hypothetical protein
VLHHHDHHHHDHPPTTPSDAIALRIALQLDDPVLREAMVETLNAQAEATAGGYLPCPGCGHEGPHDPQPYGDGAFVCMNCNTVFWAPEFYV